ncbi:MAG: ParA family protein [Actinobacteria bacterium]|nr:ParA family protein [Actinomycetota bacterium]
MRFLKRLFEGKNLSDDNKTSKIVVENTFSGEEHPAEERKQPLKRIIAIANQKGGVGKSTTAVNLSAYLGHYGFETLLVDMDPQSNSTSGVGINPSEVKSCIYEVIISGLDPNEVILKTRHHNLDVLPSSIRLAGAEVELVASFKREYKLREAIEKIRKDYDFIIIDCPPALGLLTINALAAANEVIIPIQCEYYALEGLGQLINTIDLIKKNLNERLEITGAVMTMYDSRTRLAEEVIGEVRKHFPEKVYETIIPRNVRLSEAPSYGEPILIYDPECKGAIAYENLTKEVIKNG